MKKIDDVTFHPSGRMALVSDSKDEYSYKAFAYSIDATLHQNPQLPTIVLSLLVAELNDKVDGLRHEIDALKAREA